jgi:hypothetical protein
MELMMAGYWLKPDDGKCVLITEHHQWVRNQKNAEDLGIPAAVYQEIMRLPETDQDGIRILALKCGLVRIRENKRDTSIQFWAEANRLEFVLRAVVKAMNGVEIHPDTRLIIGNLLPGERVAMTLRELDAHLENGEPVFPTPKS